MDQQLVDQGVQCIKQYYCDCKNGMRTAGCCSHVMCLIYYLGCCPQNVADLQKVGKAHDAFFDNPLPGNRIFSTLNFELIINAQFVTLFRDWWQLNISWYYD